MVIFFKGAKFSRSACQPTTCTELFNSGNGENCSAQVVSCRGHPDRDNFASP